MKSAKGCLTAILTVLAVTTLAAVLTASYAAITHDGSCLRWDGAIPGETCTRLQHVRYVWAVAFLFALANWPVSLIVLISLAGLGYLLGVARANRATGREIC